MESSRMGAVPGPSADLPAVPLPQHLEIVQVHTRTKAQHIALLEANLARLQYNYGKAESFEPASFSLSSIAPAIRLQMVSEPGRRQFLHLYSSGPFDVVAMPLTAPEFRQHRDQLRGFGGKGGTQKLAVIGFKHPNEAARARNPELMVKAELYGLIRVSRAEDLHSRLLAVPPEANVAYNLRQLLHY